MITAGNDVSKKEATDFYGMNAPHRPPYIFNKDTLKLRVELDHGVVEVDVPCPYCC